MLQLCDSRMVSSAGGDDSIDGRRRAYEFVSIVKNSIIQALCSAALTHRHEIIERSSVASRSAHRFSSFATLRRIFGDGNRLFPQRGSRRPRALYSLAFPPSSAVRGINHILDGKTESAGLWASDF